MQSAPVPSICPAGKHFSCLAICQLLAQPFDDRFIYPRLYLSASHEVFAITLITTWVLTIIWYPHQIFEHPARPIIGSFNPCFGWDYAPASYIALTFCSCNVYLTWKYAYLERVRTRLLNPEGLTCVEAFSCRASMFLAIASNTWLLLWVIGPNADHPRDTDGPVMRNWFIHTAIFVMYAAASFSSALGNFLEVYYGPTSHIVERSSIIFIIIYGISVVYIMTVYFYDLAMYEFGEDPALHPIVTQIADFFWMGCVSSITQFLPRQPPLRIQISVVTQEEEQQSLKETA